MNTTNMLVLVVGELRKERKKENQKSLYCNRSTSLILATNFVAAKEHKDRIEGKVFFAFRAFFCG